MKWADKKSIKIHGKNFKIKRKKMEDDDGVFDKKTSEIIIEESLSGKEFQQTLLHEEFHAVCFMIGANQGINKDVEEILVESLSKFVVENYKLTPR